MPQLLTVGETMAALSPDVGGPLRYVSDYRMHIAGAESNVAINLQKLGISAAWVSRLGEDELGYFILHQIRAEGVDCSGVRMDAGHRTGLMLKQTGPGETRVFYYRENSAASHLCPEDLDESQFADNEIVHLTGITPVLSDSCHATVRRAMEMATQYGCKVSFDPNIRLSLWGEEDWGPVLTEMMFASQIVLLGVDEAELLLQTREPDEIFDRLLGENVEQIALKCGAQGAWVADAQHRLRLDPWPCHCIDPVGAGDAFNAGFLAGKLQQRSLADCGRMGTIAGALATESLGDIEGTPDAARMEAALNRQEEIYR